MWAAFYRAAAGAAGDASHARRKKGLTEIDQKRQVSTERASPSESSREFHRKSCAGLRELLLSASGLDLG